MQIILTSGHTRPEKWEDRSVREAQHEKRIYKNGSQTSACGADFPGLELSIPMFGADFLHGSLKSVEVAPNLPPLSVNLGIPWVKI